MRQVQTLSFKFAANTRPNAKAVLQQAIASFPLAKKCTRPGFCHGMCDAIGHEFLKHAKTLGLAGTLLAVDNPRVAPTKGYGYWGGEDECISHYVAFFPTLNVTVDFAARQFWYDAPVPLVETLAQTQKRWKELPFGKRDSRNAEGDMFDYS